MMMAVHALFITYNAPPYKKKATPNNAVKNNNDTHVLQAILSELLTSSSWLNPLNRFFLE
jgi:hypothetical protein